MQKSCLSTGSHGPPSRPLSTCHCLAPDRLTGHPGHAERRGGPTSTGETSRPSCPRPASYAARSPAATPSFRTNLQLSRQPQGWTKKRPAQGATAAEPWWAPPRVLGLWTATEGVEQAKGKKYSSRPILTPCPERIACE